MSKQSDVVERGCEKFDEYTGKEKEGEMNDEREIEGKHRKASGKAKGMGI